MSTKSNLSTQKVLVVGAGGVGTMAAVALERSGMASVTAVLRSNYEKVVRDGFEIDSVNHGKLSNWKPTHGEYAIKLLARSPLIIEPSRQSRP